MIFLILSVTMKSRVFIVEIKFYIGIFYGNSYINICRKKYLQTQKIFKLFGLIYLRE